MKKNLWIFAAAAVALAACSNDDTIAQYQEDAINFNTVVEGVTRATGITTANIESFYVTANKAEGGLYFATDPVQFTKQESTNFTSATKYYWPSTGKLDFIAFAPATGNTISRTDSTHFSVTPAATPSAQEDFVYAVVRGQDKSTGGNGVQINFRHAESDIVIQLKNTSTDKKFTVSNVSLNYIKPTGAFAPVYKSASEIGFCTNGTAVSNVTNASEAGYYITGEAWTASGTETSYSQAATTTAYAAETSTAVALPADMILIPQALTVATAYSAAASTSGFNGANITVQLKIQDAQNHYLAGTASDFVTAMWPLAAATWLPGHRYTYTLDLAGGGYYPTNQDETAELDPILENAEIFFLAPTVDEWIDAPGIAVAGPTE